MKSDEVEFLEGGNYISFATRKRSGEFVATPVWFAPFEGSYYLFSAGEAGKVKRLRNFSQSRIAACTMRGAVTGDWMDSEAELLESNADKDIALQSLRKKYGLQMKIGDVFANISGKMAKRAYIKVSRA
ncbi:MAG: PPOX class F420-dependent oxidoreductase [Proteobacteria bacterium]|nr:PPOX class F420-dependent oxidoreductase [Pseudomonadota bacterium]